MVGQSCQANDVFTVEQTRRLANNEARVTNTGLKLGVVKTNIRNGRDFLPVVDEGARAVGHGPLAGANARRSR